MEKKSIHIPGVKLGSQGSEVSFYILLLSYTRPLSRLYIQVSIFEVCNLQVSRLGFGCAGLYGGYNASLPHEVGCSVIKEAFSKGITHFNTADSCGVDHDNEIMIGKVLQSFNSMYSPWLLHHFEA